MDILAHGIWAGLGLRWLATRRAESTPAPRRALAAGVVAAAVAPDLLHMLPVLAWGVVDGGGWMGIWRYATVLPGSEPGLSDGVAMAAHHLHCVGHSAPIALLVTLLLWRWRAWAGLPLAGWWSHIVIDVFTHSTEFYPVPVLYPFTYRGFDGIAWNTPWFMALNYLAIVASAIVLWRRR